MSCWWSRASIRVRLTAWYTAVLSLLLVLYATATFLAVRHEFREQLEEQLHRDLESQTAEHDPDPERRLQEQLREILVGSCLVSVIVALAGVWRLRAARRALPQSTNRSRSETH